MKNRALYMNGKLNLSFKELDIPKPQPGEVLLKVGYCGVCGSDVHFYESGCIGTTPIEGDLILGHEAAGTVEAIGEGVTNVKSVTASFLNLALAADTANTANPGVTIFALTCSSFPARLIKVRCAII